ncbi:MAG: type II toxin-antitoxin system prevent-host-death family antitoxin [Lachnospiraceae bacterium]|jgi:prevent-host-death family protein|nr:type II toxin-antitoxin system prevent-host-death family antitoxin [Lachnospiraceae bacterium]
MPSIKSSADLRNNYNMVSEQAHEYGEPIFITKNGKGDLAVMSIEAYEDMQGRLDLYEKVNEGLDDVKSGNMRPAEDVIKEIRAGIRK